MHFHTETPSMQYIIPNYHKDLLSLTVYVSFKKLVKVGFGKNNARFEKSCFLSLHLM